MEHRSALLASRGIASLALCYIHAVSGGGTESDKFEAVEDFEYFEVRFKKNGRSLDKRT